MGKNYSKEAFIEQRQQQMTEILKNLEEGVRQVFTSENYIRYLETFSKFHDYSFNNIILILMQFPQASFVASYQDWNKKFERIVKKGEHGIKILVPTPKKITVEKEVSNPDGGSVKNFVALVKNSSFLVRIIDMTILIEKEFIYGSSKRPNPTDYYRKQHYQCG